MKLTSLTMFKCIQFSSNEYIYFLGNHHHTLQHQDNSPSQTETLYLSDTNSLLPPAPYKHHSIFYLWV